MSAQNESEILARIAGAGHLLPDLPAEDGAVSVTDHGLANRLAPTTGIPAEGPAADFAAFLDAQLNRRYRITLPAHPEGDTAT